MSKQWIAVADRLPDDRTNEGHSHSDDVNILYEDEVISTGSYRYLNILKWCDYLYGDRDIKVIAWQPLPAPATPLPQTEVGEDEMWEEMIDFADVIMKESDAIDWDKNEISEAKFLVDKLKSKFTITKKQ